jgi:acetylornithine deacetylase
VAIPSVNPSLDPEQGTGEEQIADFAVTWLRERGVRAWPQPLGPGRSNAVGEVGGGDGPTLVLCAHVDTVATRGMTDPFVPRVEGGRLYGRGAYDMKAGAAAVMAAMAELAREPPRGRVLAALVADEEHASLGAQAFVAAYPADGCILTEPSEERLVLAHKGFAWLEVTVHGRAAHGSRFDLGDSAIENAAAFVAAVRRHDREVLRQRVADLVGAASQHVALIAGGSGWSTYADTCVVKVERRTLPGETGEQARAELVGLARDCGIRADVELVLERPPLRCDPASRVAVAAREALREVTGAEPEVAGVAYWMDAALFAAAGIPTVDVGPIGAGAHELEEWVDLASTARVAKTLVAAARRFAATG